MTRKQFLQKEIARLEEQIETARRLGDRDEVDNLNTWLRIVEEEMKVDHTKEVPNKRGK